MWIHFLSQLDTLVPEDNNKNDNNNNNNNNMQINILSQLDTLVQEHIPDLYVHFQSQVSSFGSLR